VKSRKQYLPLLALILFTFAAIPQTKTTTQATTPKVVPQAEFFVVGIEARTTAAKETSDQGIIPQQWQKFMREATLQKIPNKVDQNIYVVYTDFADRRYGEYAVVIGARVTDKSQVPAGMVVKTVPAGKYAVFQTEKGPLWQVAPAGWQGVADSEDKGTLGYIRTYKADYEVYSGAAFDLRNLQAELFVGVK